MKRRIYPLLILAIPLLAQAAGFGSFGGAPAPDEDTLKFYLSKSDCVVLATITNVICATTDPSAPRYLCTIKIDEVYKGDPHMTGSITNVSIQRREEKDTDQHPSLHDGGKCTPFLKIRTDGVPGLRSADDWFGVQYPNSAMGSAIKRLSQPR
jgi:hypothetical protein